MAENSLFFSIRFLPTFTLETKSLFLFYSLKYSLLADSKQGHSGLFFRNKYNYHTIIDPSESSPNWFWSLAWTEMRPLNREIKKAAGFLLPPVCGGFIDPGKRFLLFYIPGCFNIFHLPHWCFFLVRSFQEICFFSAGMIAHCSLMVKFFRA